MTIPAAPPPPPSGATSPTAPSAPAVEQAPATPETSVTPPEGAAPTTPAAEVTPETAAPDAKPTSESKLLEKAIRSQRRVDQMESRLRENEKKLAAKEKEIEERAAKLQQVAELEKLISEDPVEAARRLAGGDEKLPDLLRSLTDRVVQGNGQGVPKELQAALGQLSGLQKELEEAKARVAAIDKEREEERAQLARERQAYEDQKAAAQVEHFFTDMRQQLEKAHGDEVELALKAPGAFERVKQIVMDNSLKAAKEAQRLGRQPALPTLADFRVAAKQVDEELEKGTLSTLLQTNRARARLQPSKEVPLATSAAPATPKTISEDRGEPPPSPDLSNLSDYERLRLWRQGKLKIS